MKKNYIAKLFAMMISSALLVSSCGNKKADHKAAHEDPAAIEIDSDLAHLLKPSDEQVVSRLPIIRATYGSKIFTEEAQGIINYDSRNENNLASRVSGRIERLLIKYNYQPVHKGQLIMEIYSADLAAAQQELLFLKRSNDQVMLESAKQRLSLLGMTASGISQLLRTEKVSYRIPVYSNADGYILEKTADSPTLSTTSAATPVSGGDGMAGMTGGAANASTPTAPAAPVNSPVLLREGQYVNAGQSLFTIYKADQLVAEFSLKPAVAALIKKGHKLAFYKTADKSTLQNAVVGLIQPVFKNGENFTIARVYLNQANFRVGELLTAKIPVLFASSWWLPESAVSSLGNKTVLFKKEGNVVIPKAVKRGVSIAGLVQIKEDIGNWEVSKNAAYLVDSESLIQVTENGGH